MSADSTPLLRLVVGLRLTVTLGGIQRLTSGETATAMRYVELGDGLELENVQRGLNGALTPIAALFAYPLCELGNTAEREL